MNNGRFDSETWEYFVKIIKIRRKVLSILKIKFQEIILYPISELECRLFGIPENEEALIKKYFRSRNAKRYLAAYSNDGIGKVNVQVGMDKTASSSIQEFLDQNQQLLHTHSVEYKSDWGGNNHSIPLKSIVSSRYGKIYHQIVSGNDKEQITAYNRRNLLSLCRGIKASNQETYVFFGEGICSFTKKEYQIFKDMLAVLMPNAEIRIFHCVRYNTEYASSAYQQAIKMGRYHEDAVKRYSNLYWKRINNALQVFGKKKVFVYAFEETVKHELGPVGYFLDNIGVSTSELSADDIPRKNESISHYALEILEYINRKHPLVAGQMKNHLRSRNDVVPILAISGPKYRLPNEISMKIINRASNDILWLKEYFNIEYPLNPPLSSDGELSYGNRYYEECVRAFDLLNPFIKKEFYDFVAHKLDDLDDENSIHTFDRLKVYMSESLMEINLADKAELWSR